MLSKSPCFFLSADIGGSNCRFELYFLTPSSQVKLVYKATYKSRKYPSLLAALSEFLNEAQPTLRTVTEGIKEWKENEMVHGIKPVAACLAVAGPVEDNKCFATNLNWRMDGDLLGIELGIQKVWIINDFVAVGYGLLALKAEDVVQINRHAISVERINKNKLPIACVGAGTGLGQVYLTHDGQDYNVSASEGGHTDFAPRNQLEFDMMMFVRERERVSRVSVERIVSGLGLPLIYQFLASKSPDLVSSEVTQAMLNQDAGTVITTFGLAKKDALCMQALEIFISCYGADAGNMALKTLSFGGFFIAGGIAPRIMQSKESQEIFMQNFLAKGRMRSYLQNLPVNLILNKNPGLVGARVMCLRLLKNLGYAIPKTDEVEQPLQSKL